MTFWGVVLELLRWLWAYWKGLTEEDKQQVIDLIVRLFEPLFGAYYDQNAARPIEEQDG